MGHVLGLLVCFRLSASYSYQNKLSPWQILYLKCVYRQVVPIRDIMDMRLFVI
jgi:hypothetical protein